MAGVGLTTGSGAQAPDPVVVATRVLSSELDSVGRLGGVALDSAGNIYVSNFGSKVWKVHPDGQVQLLTEALNGSSGNTVDRRGRLVQSSFVDGRLVRFDHDGTMETLATSGLSGPVGVAENARGEFVVCNCRGNSLSVVTAAGGVRTLAADPLFDCPNGITVGPDEAMYVVNFNNSHVLRVDVAGRVSTVATLDGSGNAHITYARGAFYVTRITSHDVVQVNRDGTARRWAGSGTAGLGDGPAETASLARPNGIAAAANGAFVVVNDLDGVWRGSSPTRMVLRQIGPVPDLGHPGAGAASIAERR